jgi:hypothetical protein
VAQRACGPKVRYAVIDAFKSELQRSPSHGQARSPVTHGARGQLSAVLFSHLQVATALEHSPARCDCGVAPEALVDAAASRRSTTSRTRRPGDSPPLAQTSGPPEQSVSGRWRAIATAKPLGVAVWHDARVVERPLAARPPTHEPPSRRLRTRND